MNSCTSGVYLSQSGLIGLGWPGKGGAGWGDQLGVGPAEGQGRWWLAS